jgi:NAD(P)-dependent dehydrogenase (short-subunit alcohol dehydrogenase family)
MPWTTKDIPKLNGTVAIVTGANAGLGYHAAEGLARNGATVIMACRDAQRGESAQARLRETVHGADAEVMSLDLSSLGSVRRFADQFQNTYDSLGILLNNAGVMFIPERRETADGLELTLGTNLLGHFALTGLLLDTLTSTPGSRVVSVSSFAHSRGEIDFDDLMFQTRPFDGGAAYAASKLSNILFAYELQRRFEASNVDAIAVATDPGFVRTNWLRHMRTGSTWDRARAATLGAILRIMGQSVERGSLALLRAATDPAAQGGDYYSPGGRMNRGYPVVAASSAASHDEAAARRLWDMAEALTGVVFPLSSPAAAADT